MPDRGSPETIVIGCGLGWGIFCALLSALPSQRFRKVVIVGIVLHFQAKTPIQELVVKLFIRGMNVSAVEGRIVNAEVVNVTTLKR